MHRSSIRSIALGAILALGLTGLGAGCALDEGDLDEASLEEAELGEAELSAPGDLEEVWTGSQRAQATQSLAGGWGKICSPDGNAGLYDGWLGRHCPGPAGLQQNLNNGHSVYIHRLYWCSSEGRYYYLVNDDHNHAGLIKASLVCGGSPPH